MTERVNSGPEIEDKERGGGAKGDDRVCQSCFLSSRLIGGGKE